MTTVPVECGSGWVGGWVGVGGSEVRMSRPCNSAPTTYKPPPPPISLLTLPLHPFLLLLLLLTKLCERMDYSHLGSLCSWPVAAVASSAVPAASVLTTTTAAAASAGSIPRLPPLLQYGQLDTYRGQIRAAFPAPSNRDSMP